MFKGVKRDYNFKFKIFDFKFVFPDQNKRLNQSLENGFQSTLCKLVM